MIFLVSFSSMPSSNSTFNFHLVGAVRAIDFDIILFFHVVPPVISLRGDYIFIFIQLNNRSIVIPLYTHLLYCKAHSGTVNGFLQEQGAVQKKMPKAAEADRMSP